MLPIFTTTQVKDGIDHNDLMLDLSDYMKKKEGATKTELASLTAVVANKLDVEPQHKHHISDVKDLTEALNAKYDVSEKYSYNTILSDSEKIPWLESPRVKQLDISLNRNIDGYVFYIDDKSGDLMITLNDVLIASYSIAAGKWSFETDTTEIEEQLAAQATKINDLETTIEDLNNYISKTDAVLKNHYDAILLLCEKHGMIDGDGDGASNISPQ